MILTANGTLQAATTIAKTTATIVGAEIQTSGHDFITFFCTYVKGDETGLNLYPYLRPTASGTNHPLRLWSETGGVYTAEQQYFQLTASGSYPITLDVRGVEFITLYQGGSNNDGTPTGTLAVQWTMTK